MRVLAWNYNGSGWSLVTPDLQVDGVEWTDAFQSPTDITMTLETERVNVPEMTPWLTAVGVEVEGQLRAFGIVTDSDSADQKLTVNAKGLTFYPTGMPWTQQYAAFYNTDPASLITLIWAKLQSERWGNIGLAVDSVKTSARVGVKTPAHVVNGVNVPAVDQPFILSTAETHNLAKTLEDLFTEARLEWREVVRWSGDKPSVRLEIKPRVGTRRTDVRAEIGTSVITVPEVTGEPTDYASHVLVIGTGEGEARIMGNAYTPTATRIRRVYVHQAQDIDRAAAAAQEAQRVLAAKQPRKGSIKSLVLLDSPSLPVWSLAVGDEIYLTGDSGQAGQIDRWVRILSLTSDLSSPHIRTADVIDV